MDHANKSKFFAVFLFTLIVLTYAAIAPLGQAQESTGTTQTNAQRFYEHPEGRFTVPVPAMNAQLLITPDTQQILREE